MDRPIDEPPRASAADLPSLDRLLHEPAFAPAVDRAGRTLVTAALRAELATLRTAALGGTLDRSALAVDAIAARVDAALDRDARPRLRRVFNCTGTVLHTNLGRALLPSEAVEAVARAATAPVALEFDLDAGARGERDALVEGLIAELTGAQAATVVNNNAAAVLLLLSALSNRRETVVSRGELVEIGGSFRIPDIMRQAGAKLVEVGTTNRTHLADYEQAIGARTALLMKVHTSNYSIRGFVKSVEAGELAALGRAREVPTVVDLGSGTLVELAQWGLAREPTVREALAAGADLVTFSADKLLGGPQAGIVAGRADLVAKLRRHPLRRALRVGKLTLAALESVLALYRAPERLAERLPTLRLLARPAAEMEAHALRLREPVQRAVGARFAVTDEPMASQIGSGALPVDRLTSHGLAIRVAPGRRGSLDRLERALRALPRPILGRIADKALRLDLRCVEPHDEAEFAAQWSALAP